LEGTFGMGMMSMYINSYYIYMSSICN